MFYFIIFKNIEPNVYLSESQQILITLAGKTCLLSNNIKLIIFKNVSDFFFFKHLHGLADRYIVEKYIIKVVLRFGGCRKFKGNFL